MAVVDLRSDTVTEPTDEMREAMARARVGDDVLGEDPTVRELEALAAEMLGKDRGLFVPSGTMANLVAVMSHTQRGDEVLVEAEAHTYYYEVGSISAVAGVMPRPIPGRLGYIAPDQIREAVRPPNVHFPIPRLLCLENTHNRAGGIPFSAQEMDAACVAALGVPAGQLVRSADSVMFCVSKGLSAPVGSVLLGGTDFIERARRFRKMVGGGMRQAGVIAAAGVVALRTMVARLADDHANARRLAEGVARIPPLEVDLSRVRTNMVLVTINGPLTAPEVIERLKREGVLALPTGASTIRMVTHRHISGQNIDHALDAIRRTVATMATIR